MKDLIEFQKNNQPAFSPIALTVKEFKAIWKRDKHSSKSMALKELAFVAYSKDFRSPYFHDDPNDRMHRLIRDLELPEDWRPDRVVEAALDRYAALSDTPALRALRSLVDTINLTQEGVSFAKESISKSMEDLRLLNEMDVEEMDFEDEEGKAQKLAKIINKAKDAQLAMITNIKTLLDLQGKMEPAITALEKLTERVQKAESESSAIQGGGEVGAFED